ncbi:MAG: hypothetical protein PGN13_10905 [Patulibacter minatonensis]
MARGLGGALLVGVLLLAGVIGCGVVVLSGMEKTAAPGPADTARLAAFAQDAPAATYWLGREFDGERAWDLGMDELFSSIAYGEPTCSGSVCASATELDNIHARTDFATDDPAAAKLERGCWRRLGRVWLVQCAPGAHTVHVFTARSVITIARRTGDAARVARGLRRVRDGAAVTAGEPVARFTCAESTRDLAPLVRTAPAELRPRHRCAR